MLKIGEFSKLTQVSIRMLRHYDEVGLLKPANVDESSGYRFYTVEQIPILNKIIFLRDAGFLIAEISNILTLDDEAFIKVIQDKKEAVAKTIQDEQDKLICLETIERELRGEQKVHYDIFIKQIPSYPVVSLRRILLDYYHEGELWQEMSQFSRQKKLNIGSVSFSIYHDDDFKERDVDVEICVQTDVLLNNEGDFRFYHSEPVEMVASTMVYGPFSKISGAYRSFASWLQQHQQYQMLGGSRQIVHRGPWNEKEEANYVIEMQIPICRR